MNLLVPVRFRVVTPLGSRGIWVRASTASTAVVAREGSSFKGRIPVRHTGDAGSNPADSTIQVSARVDQRRDRRADIPKSAGSIPAVRTTNMGTCSNGKMPRLHRGDEGSTPSVSTIPSRLLPLHEDVTLGYELG